MGIELDQMPDYEMDHLCAATIKMIKRYFSLPGVQEQFEAWLVEYRKRPGVKSFDVEN